MSIWGKPDLNLADIDTATVGDIARFVKQNLVDSRWVSSFDWNHRGWLMDPHCGLSLLGERSPCPTLELWNYVSVGSSVCLFVGKISQKINNRFWWTFVTVGKETQSDSGDNQDSFTDSGSVPRTLYHQDIGSRLTVCGVSRQDSRPSGYRK